MPAKRPRERAPIYRARNRPKLKIRIPPTRPAWWWDDVAAAVLAFYVAERGAFVWPEAEADLAESSWVHDHCDPNFPARWQLNSHHLKRARSTLGPSVIRPITETLNKRPVTVWVDAAAIDQRGSKTRVLSMAAGKRRSYRTFLTWTGDQRLCGSIGEAVVGDTLRSLAGTHLWLPPDAQFGRISSLQGRPITIGGPLDAAGEWPIDRQRLAAGAHPFAVEVKNVRSILYPYDHDVWDLLAKMSSFPDVLPVLVARRVHWTTFRMFKDLGALATQTRRQYFASSIDSKTFASITSDIGLRDATQYDGDPDPALRKWFSITAPKATPTQLAKWQRSAGIAARYTELREADLDEASRSDLFSEFANELNQAGLYGGGWAKVFEEDDQEAWFGPEEW